MIYFLTMEKQIGNLQCETSHVLGGKCYTLMSHTCSFSELHSQVTTPEGLEIHGGGMACPEDEPCHPAGHGCTLLIISDTVRWVWAY